MLNITDQHLELKRKARYAGLLYLGLIILGFYMTVYVAPNIQVEGDPQATFDNLLENEFLFRTGIFGVLLILGGAAYFIESTVFILFPGAGRTILSMFIVFYAVGPISFMLWLLIKGVRTDYVVPAPEES